VTLFYPWASSCALLRADAAVCVGLASIVLWAGEARKLVGTRLETT
jgi:hypothetical protein